MSRTHPDQSIIRAFLAFVGGILGCAVALALMAYLMEVGVLSARLFWAAWIVGLLCGIGVRLGGRHASALRGVLAVVLVIPSVLLAPGLLAFYGSYTDQLERLDNGWHTAEESMVFSGLFPDEALEYFVDDLSPEAQEFAHDAVEGNGTDVVAERLDALPDGERELVVADARRALFLRAEQKGLLAAHAAIRSGTDLLQLLVVALLASSTAYWLGSGRGDIAEQFG